MFDVFSVRPIKDGFEISEVVEMGLSPGEVRQSIIDRANENIRKNYTETIHRFISTYSEEEQEEFSEERLREKFEDLLYDLDDDDLRYLLFDFEIDPVWIVEER